MVCSISPSVSMPSRSSCFSSSAKASAALLTPCVSEPTQTPPLRPLAWPPATPASRTTTSACGSRSLASSAAQRPEKPAPTTARSQVSAPASAGRGAAAGNWSSQNGASFASPIARRARDDGVDFEGVCRAMHGDHPPRWRRTRAPGAPDAGRGLRNVRPRREGWPARPRSPSSRAVCSTTRGCRAKASCPEPKSGSERRVNCHMPADQQRARILLRSVRIEQEQRPARRVKGNTALPAAICGRAGG